VNARFLLIGTLACMVAIFAWQTLSNTLLPWHVATMREFASDDATVQAIRNAAPTNGVYYSHQGVFAAVSFVPGVADKRTLLGAMLGKQAVINVFVALLLCVLVSRLPVQRPLATGITVATAGLASAIVIEFSNWNWYGVDASFAAVNVLDQTVQFFIGGWVLGLIARKLGTTPARTAEYVGVPPGQGYAPGTRPQQTKT
jgi:hypothetical protein